MLPLADEDAEDNEGECPNGLDDDSDESDAETIDYGRMTDWSNDEFQSADEDEEEEPHLVSPIGKVVRDILGDCGDKGCMSRWGYKEYVEAYGTTGEIGRAHV